MTADHLIGIERFEADLWKVADNLRANSNLASNEYFMPILGLIFLRHATNRYYAATAAIEEDKAAGRMPDRPLVEADFTRRRALMLPGPARYNALLGMPKDGSLGAAVTAAMEAVEDHFPPLAGQLPKDYERFEDDVLEEMMRTFDSEALRTASGDVFGRIYEYFLAEFSKQGAHDNGEFFTPPSIVQTIVNVIEPDHGVVLDPACGSGGMFVQSSHFIEDAGEDTMKRVTFYGHEKNETTAKLAQVNLAVHGLEGRIRAGNEAITYYKDPHELAGRCDFVMANPPFNVDEVDAEKVKGDKRLPFGLPGVNKAKKVSNANYLWLSYFYGYLNENGRAGVVMSSQASSAGRDEAKVRQKLVESGAVDVMIDIRGNFFYTRTVPCQLWFFDRAKERDEMRRDQVLMLDARNIHRKVSRAIFDFSPGAPEEHRRHRVALSRAVGPVPRARGELPRPGPRERRGDRPRPWPNSRTPSTGWSIWPGPSPLGSATPTPCPRPGRSSPPSKPPCRPISRCWRPRSPRGPPTGQGRGTEQVGTIRRCTPRARTCTMWPNGAGT